MEIPKAKDMTLYEYYAGQALAGLLASAPEPVVKDAVLGGGAQTSFMIAKAAWEYATELAKVAVVTHDWDAEAHGLLLPPSP